jgi:hypothetical protein
MGWGMGSAGSKTPGLTQKDKNPVHPLGKRRTGFPEAASPTSDTNKPFKAASPTLKIKIG